MRTESTATDVTSLGSPDACVNAWKPSDLFEVVRSTERGWYRMGLPLIRPEHMESVREIVRAHLRLWHRTELSFIAELGVTELLTNVYKHTRGDCELVLSETDTGVFVGVSDFDLTLPVIREPSDDEVGGRGLFLLAAMADEFGTEPHGSGKQVWFRLGPEVSRPAEEESAA